MINILIKTESHYRINRNGMKNTAEKFLLEKSIKGNVELSISIVGDRLMRELNSKYRRLDETTTVLTFGLLLDGESEKPFIQSPDNVLRLGDIVISYPQARERAIEDEMLVDDKINELIIHGLNNLTGN